jgi:hypothetical protein
MFINLNFEIFMILINTLKILIYNILLNLKEKKIKKVINNTFKALLIKVNKGNNYYLNFYFILIKSFLITFITFIIFIINTFINSFIFFILDNKYILYFKIY